MPRKARLAPRSPRPKNLLVTLTNRLIMLTTVTPRLVGSAAVPSPPPQAKFINVVNSPPLGLRYTVLKRVGNQTSEISPEAVFRSGDRIQLGIDVSDAGYLYIVNQGSSGKWTVLFPSPEIAHGDNHVESGHNYVVPQGHVFSFVGDPGTEKLFVILSRQREQAMDQLIYSIQRGEPSTRGSTGKEQLGLTGLAGRYFARRQCAG